MSATTAAAELGTVDASDRTDLDGETSGKLRELVAARHGFLVETVTRDTAKPVRSTCKYCGERLPLGNVAVKQRTCEHTELMEGCECSGCETHRLWLAREYFGTGRPRTQCGRPECQRKLDAERKRRNRLEKRRSPTKQHCQAAKAGASGPGSRHVVFPETRKPTGTHADPTGETAAELVDRTTARWQRRRFGPVVRAVWVGTPSACRGRELFYADAGTALPVRLVESRTGPVADEHSAFDTGLSRPEFYQAQVAPDLFPGEKRMLTEHWSDQDRQMYCGERHTTI